MPGMLPIDRVRAAGANARARFERARERFGQKQAQIERKAHQYDGQQQAHREQATERSRRGEDSRR